MRPLLLVIATCAVLLLAAGCGSGSGATSAAAAPTATPTTPTTTASSTPPARTAAVTGPTLVAAGDIACPPGSRRSATQCRQGETANVVGRLKPDVVAPLGDLQYDSGSAREWRTGPYRTTWGRFRSISRPAIGNHEYATGSTAAYAAFYGSRAGRRPNYWYSYDLGTWHVVVLNANCSIVGCGSSSAQQRWLRSDLARHPAQCTLAYWHQPRFSSGLHGNAPDTNPLWLTLQHAGADVVLSGHDHIYERFAPQTSTGRRSATGGMVEFVVGTGGRNNYPIIRRKPNSLVRRSFVFGVLELTLGDGEYGWRFVPVPGLTFTDRGQAKCR